MIDLGLSKIAIIGVVALLVIGPEKLPKVARMVGSLYGRAQRYLNDVKSEVSREIDLEELKNLQKEVQEAAHSVKDGVSNSISSNIAQVENAWRDDVSMTGSMTGSMTDSMTGSMTPSTSTFASENVSAPVVTAEQLALKVRQFRRKKLLRSSAIPAWYKQCNGSKTRVMSGAARVAKFRPSGKSLTSFFK